MYKYAAAFLLCVTFGIIILLLTKAFRSECSSGMMYDQGRKICRDICDYDKDPSHAGGKYTHWSDTAHKCVSSSSPGGCKSGQVWNGSQCITKCMHGSYNQKTGKCVCDNTPGDLYPPVKAGEDGGGLAQLPPGVTGWEGDLCDTSKNPSCSPDAIEKLKDKKGDVCSGHGVPSNPPGYKEVGTCQSNQSKTCCTCKCDNGWSGDLCGDMDPGTCESKCEKGAVLCRMKDKSSNKCNYPYTANRQSIGWETTDGHAAVESGCAGNDYEEGDCESSECKCGLIQHLSHYSPTPPTSPFVASCFPPTYDNGNEVGWPQDLNSTLPPRQCNADKDCGPCGTCPEKGKIFPGQSKDAPATRICKYNYEKNECSETGLIPDALSWPGEQVSELKVAPLHSKCDTYKCAGQREASPSVSDDETSCTCVCK